jgi:hypothetical protein
MSRWISNGFFAVLTAAEAYAVASAEMAAAVATNVSAVAESATNTVMAQPAAPVAVFTFSESSRDPFFPNSERFKKKSVVVTNAPPDPLRDFELILTGITGVPGRRMALINRRAVQAGEEIELPGPQGKPIRVRCVDVKEESVVVIIGNSTQPKTLTLRQ